VDHAISTEIRIATADDDVRLSSFIQDFLSANDFPFFMVHSDPNVPPGAELKRVTFESDELTQRFREAWSLHALGGVRRRARGAA
jgi:hypothetical protein